MKSLAALCRAKRPTNFQPRITTSFRGVFNGIVFARLRVPAPPRVPVAGERRAAVVEFCPKQMGGAKVAFNRYTLEKDNGTIGLGGGPIPATQDLSKSRV